MKAAISTDSGYVSAHFGRCPEFTIVDISGGAIAHKEILPNPGHQPGLIPQFMKEKGVELMICGGMGQRAQMIFDQFGINVLVGVSGTVEGVMDKLIGGTLEAGESLCSPGAGKGYGLDKAQCDHPEEKHC